MILIILYCLHDNDIVEGMWQMSLPVATVSITVLDMIAVQAHPVLSTHLALISRGQYSYYLLMIHFMPVNSKCNKLQHFADHCWILMKPVG